MYESTSYVAAKTDAIKKYDDRSLAKPNIITCAKIKTTIIAEKVLFIQHFKLSHGEYIEDNAGNAIVKTAASDLKKNLKINNSGQFYTTLRKISKSLNENKMGYYDSNQKKFLYEAFGGTNKYENGIFETKFSCSIKELFNAVEKSGGFTLLPIDVMMNWRSISACKLYPQLKMKTFYKKDYEGPRNGEYEAEYDINELKLILGVIDPNQSEIKEELTVGGKPDYRAVCKKAVNKIYKSNTYFMRDCIHPALKEINEISDLFVEFKGYGNKIINGEITKIQFKIKDKFFISNFENDAASKENKDEEDNNTEDNKEENKLSLIEKRKIENEVLEEISSYIKNEQELTDICKAGKYDKEYIFSQIKYMKNLTTEIRNAYIYLYNACIKDYAHNAKKISPQTKKEAESKIMKHKLDIIFPHTYQGIPHEYMDALHENELRQCSKDLNRFLKNEITAKEYANKWNNGIYNDIYL